MGFCPSASRVAAKGRVCRGNGHRGAVPGAVGALAVPRGLQGPLTVLSRAGLAPLHFAEPMATSLPVGCGGLSRATKPPQEWPGGC